jgi:hypothetical protein
MHKPTPIKLKGIVIAAAWNKNGDVSAVDIAGYDEKRYRVADDFLGRQLRRFVKERLIIDGIVETTANRLTIHVKKFRTETSLDIQDDIRK